MKMALEEDVFSLLMLSLLQGSDTKHVKFKKMGAVEQHQWKIVFWASYSLIVQGAIIGSILYDSNKSEMCSTREESMSKKLSHVFAISVL